MVWSYVEWGTAVDTSLTVLLDRLEEEATGRGVSDKLFAELRDARPDPSVAAPFIVDLIPRCSPQGRFGVAELAVNLLKQDRGFRPAVRAAVAGYHFDTPYRVTLHSVAKDFVDEDYLWWFDLFCEFRFDTDGYFYLLLTDRFSLLMQHRRQEVIDYLANPDLGPAGANVDAVTKVLNRLGRCPPLEDQWSKWIGDGRFTRGAAPGNEGGGILGLCLQATLRDSPAAAVPLIDQAIEQWRALLASGDLHQRRDLMQTMAHMIHDRADLGGRLPQRVVTAQPPGSPERDLIEQAFATGEVMPLLEYGD
jgi:hypothetical protein